MFLDQATIHNLEILRNLRSGCAKVGHCPPCIAYYHLLTPSAASAQASLFGVMNHCKTAGGTRVLRSTLIQPCTSLDTIQLRLEAVSELLGREEALLDIIKNLPSFAESDRMLKHFMQRSKLSGITRARACVSCILLLKVHASTSWPPQCVACSTDRNYAHITKRAPCPAVTHPGRAKSRCCTHIQRPRRAAE